MRKPLKVLYVTHYGTLYGANRSMLDMILTLREKYHIVPCVLLNKHGDLEKELEKNGIDYIYGKYYSCTVSKNGKIKFLIKLMIKKVIRPFSYFMVIKNLKNHFDIIHSNSSAVDIGYYISRKFRYIHIWHIREFGWEDYNFEQIDSSRKVKDRYLNTDGVIAVSRSVEEMILDIDGQITVNAVYNGIEIPEKYEKVFCTDNKVHFCTIGVICKNKNQMEAVRAVKYLVKEGYHNFYLHIVGGEGADGEFYVIKKFIEENHLEGYVELTGYRYDVPIFLKKMDVGIMGSYKEAFGRVTIEYMSNYMPVIGVNTGGTKELIKNGENGLFYDLGDSVDLAEKMKEFIDKPYLLKDMGLRAREFSEQFTAGSNADNIYSVYMNAYTYKNR
ncbi:MAG: glycosyltransferase family 4 protein [Lachnospiraceae bacterium]|nr:glycosyltransferase family 4 protein [Lachnospiraceae bacterium]